MRRIVAIGWISLGLLAASLGGIAPASAAAICGPSWSEVPSPSVDTGDNQLMGVAAVADDDVWAVGYSVRVDENFQYVNSTLIEHWDGQAWSIVPSPNPGTGSNTLNGVAAVSATDVWAVGSFFDETGLWKNHPLVEHWDGQSWAVVDSPTVGEDDNVLNAVTAIAPDDLWAVGTYTNDGSRQTLTQHWDGTAWLVVDSPNATTLLDVLLGVTATSSQDVWAVGTYFAEATHPWQALLEHWDGTTWTIATDDDPYFDHYLTGVAAVSSQDVWAVGTAGPYQNLYGPPVSDHFDGTDWSSATLTVLGDSNLNGAAAVSAQEVWAVGRYQDDTGYGRLLSYQWDGQAWNPVVGSDLKGVDHELAAVAVSPSGQLWGVGRQQDDYSSYYRTFVQTLCPALVRDSGFSPSVTTARLGQSMAWRIPATDRRPHSLADASGMGLFDSGSKAPGSSYAFTFTGAGTYRILDRQGGHTAVVQVPAQATPRRGHPSSTFTVTWGSVPANYPFVYDVQVKRPGSTWETWKTAVYNQSATFTPDAGTGTYSFRARERSLAGGHAGWSPSASIQVG